MAVKRRWLNRDVVVKKAAGMADELGNAELITLSAVARELNVRPPSLYNHVSGVDDLRAGIALFAVDKLVKTLASAAEGLVGREALLVTALTYRRFAQEHPGIYQLTIRAPDEDDEELAALARALLQSLLLMMASLGIEGDEALHAVRGLRALLHGFVSLEVADGYKMPLDKEESLRKAVSAYLEGLAPQ